MQECANKFPIKVGDLNSEKSDHPSSDKFVLSSGDQVKVIVTLTGDAISGADINLKLPRPHTKDAYHNTTVRYSFVIPPDSQFSPCNMQCKLFSMPGTTCRGSCSRCRTRLTTCSWCRSSSPRCRTSTCSGPRTRSITSSITSCEKWHHGTQHTSYNVQGVSAAGPPGPGGAQEAHAGGAGQQ